MPAGNFIITSVSEGMSPGKRELLIVIAGIGTYVNTSEGKQRGPYDRFVTGCEKVRVHPFVSIHQHGIFLTA